MDRGCSCKDLISKRASVYFEVAMGDVFLIVYDRSGDAYHRLNETTYAARSYTNLFQALPRIHKNAHQNAMIFAGQLALCSGRAEHELRATNLPRFFNS